MKLKGNIKKTLDQFCLDHEFCATSNRIGILGPSGSGKTMTLKCIAGIETPDEGTIYMGNQVLFDKEVGTNIPARNRNVGYLFQEYALFPNMTVRENIQIGIKEKDKETIGSHFIRKFELENIETKYPGEISGGQKQRVALARILAQKPDIILLDEPFAAVDDAIKDELKREMKRYLSDYEGKLIIVSHNKEEIYEFSEELLIINEGKKVAFGKTREMFAHPPNVDAAKLLGCENISRIERINDGTIKATDWGMTLEITKDIPKDATHVGIYGQQLQLMDVADLSDDHCYSEYANVEVEEKLFTNRIAVTVKEGHSPMYLEQPKQKEIYHKVLTCSADDFFFLS